jgi:tetratricopeptide (TPR) repeat protein
MRRVLLLILLLLPAGNAAVGAQGRGGAARTGGSFQTPDSVIARALALNNDQRGAEARGLIDSLLRALQPTAPAYADALFWKAMLAESEQVAEEQYNRIVREYPLHRRAEESLIRLAQLEMTRGNRSMAQRHLDRLIVEHPYGQLRARASYWRARLFLEENELERACAELGLARARLPDGDVELRSEIEFAARRCASVPTPSVANRSNTGATPPPGTAGRATADTQTSRAGSDSGRASRGGTAQRGRAAGTGTAITYAVQAAAFPARANAEAFVEALRGRGYEARVVEGAPLFRVWIGRFSNRSDASTLVNELRSKRVSSGAFVVEAGGRE